MPQDKPRSKVFSPGPLGHAGRILFALAIIGFGVQYAIIGSLADCWPLPIWLPNGHTLAYIMAALLIGLGLEVLGGWRVYSTTLFLGMILFFSALLHLRNLLAVILHNGPRTGFLEPLAFAGACFVLHGLYSTIPRGVPLITGQIVFAGCMILFGVQHFLGLSAISALVPTWIPYPNFWTVATGAGMIAAGLAILTGVLDRMAAFALFTMFLIWLGALHIPLLIAEPRNADLYSSALVVVGMCGASLLMAATARPGKHQDRLLDFVTRDRAS